MIKNLLFTLIAFLICISKISIAQNKNRATEAKALRLKRAYQQATTSADKKRNELQFFNEFPNTFNELNALYGYVNDKPAPLYHDAVNHILNLFNNLKTVKDTLYFKKIVSIAKNAYWDADAVSYFQDGVQKRVVTNPGLTLYVLRSLTEKEITGFWAFYFDYEDATIRKSEYTDLLKRLSKIDKNAVRLIDAGYTRSTNLWKNSH
ncbi:MAG: hypothetical protein V4619_09815 [Bacteroidota bacterium]